MTQTITIRNPINRRLKVKKINIYYVLSVVFFASFFMPKSVNTLMLRGYNVHFNKCIEWVFTVISIAVSFYSIIEYVMSRGKKYKTTSSQRLMICTVFLLLFSVFVNGSISPASIKNFIIRLGFIFFCIISYNKNSERFMKTGKWVFMIYSIIGVVSIFLYPNGFLSDARKQDAVFALGSKNSGYCFYFYFLFFYIIYNYKKCKKIPKLIYVVLLIFTFAARICDSGNTTIIMILMIIILLFIEPLSKSKFANPYTALIGILIISVIIYGGAQLPFIQHITNSIGRDMTFTGRSILWATGFEFFLTHPVFGAGDGILFPLGSGNAVHAHSEYINCLAKYGLLPFMFFVISLVLVCKKINKMKDRKAKALLSALMFVNLLHMAFDVFNYNFTLLMIILLDFSATSKHNLMEEKQ